MDNPLELPAPNDPIERVRAFARDLAYGALHAYWSSTITVNENGGWDNFSDSRSTVTDRFFRKWGNVEPSFGLLVSFGFVEKSGERGTKGTTIRFETDYTLTPKSFLLLEQPLEAPKIFVSYKRDQSSALGLLIEARIKMQDRGIGIFIDKELAPGDKWHGRLEREVRQRQYFICLLGPKSLCSEYVRREIEWALDDAQTTDKVIIPMCHNGYNFDAALPEDLQQYADEINALMEQLRVHNAIVINPEGAEQYELAMIKLLNRLGYSNI